MFNSNNKSDMVNLQNVDKANSIKSTIEEILTKNLPELAYRSVWIGKNCIGNGLFIGIQIAASGYDINGVSNQKCQMVSLRLGLDDMELSIQVFGGCGGGRIDLIPDKNKPEEKYLASVGCKIPFRKPKAELKFVLSAIEKFANNWIIALDENFDRLKYKEYVDYKELLK
jgi:hypothetical protein